MRANPPEFVLLSILCSYPDEAFLADLRELLLSADVLVPEPLGSRLNMLLSGETPLDELRSEYLALFDSGRGVAPLYESEYGRSRVFFKANVLAAVAGFYRAFGFELGDEGMAREMPDHLSVELEFYALLCLQQEQHEGSGKPEAMEIVHQARKKFLSEHLGRFVPAVLGRPQVADSIFYSEMLRYCAERIHTECERLGVVPVTAEWMDGEKEAGELSCGCAAGGRR